MSTNPKKGFFISLRNHWISILLLLIPLSSWLLGKSLWQIPELYQHLLLTLTAVMAIHLIDRLFLQKDMQKTLDNLIKEVRIDLKTQTDSLINSSKSLQAIHDSGIIRVFSTRLEAAPAINTDITSSNSENLLLIGISLNDFVQGAAQSDSNFTLLRAWDTIQKLIKGEDPLTNRKELNIRVLIIDPYSFGAQLRSKAESESDPVYRSRLTVEVIETAKELLALSEIAKIKCKETKVTFDCRMYRIPPVLFLCWMDNLAYVQQYHFWSKRKIETPIPVIKYGKLESPLTNYPYHQELEHHFNWIWDYASIQVQDFILNEEIGIDNGMHISSAENVYTNPEKACKRIVNLLKNSNNRVTIQGISLHSYFKPGQLKQEIISLIKRGIKLDVLLLDPECEQAKFRSYRECLLNTPDLIFKDYTENVHKDSDLYSDTKKSMNCIKQILGDIIKNSDNKQILENINIRKYKTAPACFVLRIDDKILVEQYHYGKVDENEYRALLGKDMPLVEYNSEASPLYTNDTKRVRQPYNLLVDHLEYVLKQAEEINLALDIIKK